MLLELFSCFAITVGYSNCDIDVFIHYKSNKGQSYFQQNKTMASKRYV